MKKKIITMSLSSMLLVGIVAPIMSSAANYWNYGYDQSRQEDYSEYRNDFINHAAGITKKGILYKTSSVKPGYVASMRLAMNGPYKVQYHKFDY